jgi:hypothetical protein
VCAAAGVVVVVVVVVGAIVVVVVGGSVVEVVVVGADVVGVELVPDVSDLAGAELDVVGSCDPVFDGLEQAASKMAKTITPPVTVATLALPLGRGASNSCGSCFDVDSKVAFGIPSPFVVSG